MATLSPAAFFSRSPSLFSSSAATALIHSSVSLKSNPASSWRLARAMSVRASTSLDSPLEVCAKASVTVPNRLGDCPFTQRVLLTLEEKHLPYDIKLVDLAKKPDWFLQVSPEGKVPVIKLDDKWVADSDIITKSLEEMYPVPSLETPPEKASAQDPTDGTEQALLDELTSFNEYLKENGPFVNGDNISAADLSLGPKLFHMEIALGHYKNWSVPESLDYVTTYMKLIFSKDSFVKTRALPEDVIAGWRPKVFA
ncbi:putative glutathione S-transferase DHAR2, chloroplastic isoform X2 [Curcuma longa]|uniref:putative glutathione S-transferase DHAR2, chloroplastic isoform X2 n=1 Tax=Curcuma longa TaxID=136217 RepID=UPI003D9EE74C